MYTLKNPTKTDSWFVDLNDHCQVENDLPQNYFIVRNDSNIIIYVELYGIKVGEVQRYSSDTFIGRDFEDFKLYNPDGNQFEVNDLFVQMSKGQVMTSQPFNPQWDMMEDDLDKYSNGCDSRISLSATLTLDMLKYWLNAQNDLIVQRRLSVAGTAAMGTYETDFEGDVVSGNCGINATVLDIQKLRKTLSNSALNFTNTDCTINGLVFDYKKGNDISDDYTVVVGGADAPKVYDNDPTTEATYTHYGSVYENVWEVSFSSVDVTKFHTMLKLYGSTGSTAYAKVDYKIDGVWETVVTDSNDSVDMIYTHSEIIKNTVTGIRIWLKNEGAFQTAAIKIYDIAVF